MSIDKKALPPYDGKIEIGIYWYQDEETGEIIYDFEEMANEFENKLAELDPTVIVMCSIESNENV
jgi:hypothetical protein